MRYNQSPADLHNPNITIKLGKIKSVKFGLIGYQECQLGFAFDLTFGESMSLGTIDQWCNWAPGLVDPSDTAQWTEQSRNEGFTNILHEMSFLLQRAGKKELSELRNVPIEVRLNGLEMVSWRILTEVL